MNENAHTHKAESQPPHDSLNDKAGQYLTFSLGDDEYGLEILQVQEFVGLMPLKRAPNTPSFIRGIMNLRGDDIAVMELRARFHLDSREDTESTSIIVIHGTWKDQKATLGLLVDEVSEVTEITEEEIEPPPSDKSLVRDSFLIASAKIDDKVILLLDIDKILQNSNLSFVV
jgi:purine-binding chemotaxis protein CheW